MFPTVRKNQLCEKFGFNHHQPFDFAVFSWQQSKRNQVSGYYIVYRFMAAALFLSVVVYCGARSNHPEYWLIYLSHIGLILQTLHLALSAAVPVQLLLLSYTGRVDKNTTLLKLSWFLYNTTNLISLLISTVFWAVLFVPGRGLKDKDVLVHALNSIMSICDIFISKRPCRMLHFYQSLAALGPYVIFSAIYWGAGGRRENGLSYIYPILNWDNLSLTVPFVTVGMMIGLPLVHGLIWSLHYLRDRAIYCVKKETFDEQDESNWNPAFVLDETSANNVTVISLKPKFRPSLKADI